MPSKLVSLSLTLFFVCVSITFERCKAAGQATEDPPTLSSIVKNKIGEPYTLEYNEDKRYVLCQQSRVNDHSGRSFQFIVIRTADNTIVKEGAFRLGYVRWRDNDSLEVTSSTGASDSGDKKIVAISDN